MKKFIISGVSLVIFLLITAFPNPLYCDMQSIAVNPAILFCSTQETEYRWIDLVYLAELHQKGFEVDYIDTLADLTWERINKYNVLVIYASPHTEAFVSLIENYLSAGGGVLMMAYEHNIGKQTMADVTDRWGVKIAVERIVEKAPNKLASFRHTNYPAAFTDQVYPSPVSQGVKGIWYPYIRAYNAQQTCPLWVSDDWQIVVTASETAVTEPVDLEHSPSGPVENPFIRPDGVKSPPLFAIRTYPPGGEGRIAFISQWPQFSVGQGTKWLYNREILSKGLKDIPSDFGQLLENTYRWLAEPSLKNGALGGYKTLAERLLPPNKPPDARRGYEEISWTDSELSGYGRPSQGTKLFRGLIGVKSSYSTGQGTVAEYAATAQQAGLDFIAFMEDFDHLTPEKFEKLKSECQKYSNDKVWLYAGYTIRNNIGNSLFFFGPEVLWPPERCLTGPNNTLLNQQNQDKDGNFLNKQGPVLDWLLTACHLGSNKAQVGFYNFAGSGRGMRMTDLRTYGMAAVRFYDHGKLIEDVTDDYLTTAQGTLPPAPASVNIVTSPDELLKEAKSGRSLIYAQGRSLASLFDESLRWTHQYDGVNVFISDGPQILAWPRCHRVGTLGSEEFVTGRILMPSAIWVKSEKGLKEIRIYDGQNLFRRFKLDGEKEWEQTLWLEGAVQKNLVLIVEDVAGGVAVSFARRCWKDGAREVAFCSDHVNDCKSYGMLLGRGPATVPVSIPPDIPVDVAGYTWDGGPAGVLPLVVFQGNEPILDSDQGVEDGTRFNQIPTLEFSDEGAVAVASVRNEIFDESVPSGEVMNPWHGYGPKGPSRLFAHTLRYREFVTPTVGVPETGWAGPGVREGANACLFRGEIRFKRDLKLKSLLLLRNWHVPKVTPVFLVVKTPTDIKEIDVTQLSTTEKFILQSGDWFGFYSPGISNSHIFVNRSSSLRLEVTNPDLGGNWVTVWAEVEGMDVKGNDTYTYELSSIAFPVDVEVKRAPDVIHALDYVTHPTGMSVQQGRQVDLPGLLEFVPTDHLVEIRVPKPKDRTHLILPLRVQGLNRHWSVGLFQKAGYVKGDYGTGDNRYRPLGLDLYGVAYVPLYVDYAEQTHIVVGHPVVAEPEGKDLFIQVTHVNENPHRWHVSVNNPTDKAITTTLRKTMDVPGFEFPTQRITVPPGGYLVVKAF